MADHHPLTPEKAAHAVRSILDAGHQVRVSASPVEGPLVPVSPPWAKHLIFLAILDAPLSSLWGWVCTEDDRDAVLEATRKAQQADS